MNLNKFHALRATVYFVLAHSLGTPTFDHEVFFLCLSLSTSPAEISLENILIFCDKYSLLVDHLCFYSVRKDL